MLPSARAELEACKAAGLEAEWVDDADVPFPFHGGVRLAEQAQFDPMPLLDSLIVELEERGGRLAQGVRVQKVSGEGDELALHVRTTDADEFTVKAKQCVLATGIPILDRGGFFARLKPQRSYCMAYRVPGNITSGMYISTDSPTRSVRYAPTEDGQRLIVGGAGHPVGHAKHPASSVQELDAWAKLHYPGAMQTHYWSAQDYSPIDELPYVGPILPGQGRPARAKRTPRFTSMRAARETTPREHLPPPTIETSPRRPVVRALVAAVAAAAIFMLGVALGQVTEPTGDRGPAETRVQTVVPVPATRVTVTVTTTVTSP